MSDGIEIRTNAAEVLRNLRRYSAETRSAIRKGLARGLLLLEDRVRTRTDVKARHGMAGLMGRLTSYVQDMGPYMGDGVIGFRKTRGFPYEFAQETGATAKPGKMMAIPVTNEARRFSSPRQQPGLFRVGHVLAERQGRSRLVTHWVLAKSIPPRLKFKETVSADRDIVADEIVKAAK